VANAFGILYEIEGPLPSPDGRNPLVRVIWMIDTGALDPRLITLVPIGRRASDWAAVDALSDDQVEAAAIADPDAPPLRDGALLRPIAIAKRLRLRMGLGAQAFAARYHIPLELLMAWERHAAEPDAVASAYLTAIDADPDGVAAALLVRAAAE
jgi:putative transcriptional regulator